MSHWKDFSIDAVVSPVDFSFNSDDKDILAYYTLLLLALEELYYLYEFKSADYVLSHIDEDISKLQKSMLDNVNQLDKSFNEKYRDTLTKEGILPENIGKIKTLNKELLKFLKKEQTQTIKNICQELKGQLKSKIFYLKSRNSDRLFSVNSNFTKAVQRLKKLADYGVKASRGQGKKEAEMFLYGDTLVWWECLHDGKTCGFCLENEALSPFNLSDCPAYPAHPNCYSPDTDVFTKEGWKNIKEVTLQDEFLSLNPETNLTEFVKPVEIISQNNQDGFMYHIHNKWFDTCVTPDHDCFVHQRRYVNGERRHLPEFRKPFELNSESRFYRCCENNNQSPDYIDVNGLKFNPTDYAFLMAWFISEGSVLHNSEKAKSQKYPVQIKQCIKENRFILEKELKRICDYLNIEFKVYSDRFLIKSKQLHDYLLPLGYSHEKYVPNEVFMLSREDLNVFLENYVKGDGHERDCSNHLVKNSKSVCIFTSSLNLVSDLSYIALLAGYYPSISINSKAGTVVEHYNGTYTQNYDVYSISLNRTVRSHFDKLKMDKIEYDGQVYCVQLEKYHILWTKRNGKTTWNGNCGGRCNLVIKEEDKKLTPEAEDLKYYQIGG